MYTFLYQNESNPFYKISPSKKNVNSSTRTKPNGMFGFFFYSFFCLTLESYYISSKDSMVTFGI